MMQSTDSPHHRGIFASRRELQNGKERSAEASETGSHRFGTRKRGMVSAVRDFVKDFQRLPRAWPPERTTVPADANIGTVTTAQKSTGTRLAQKTAGGAPRPATSWCRWASNREMLPVITRE